MTKRVVRRARRPRLIGGDHPGQDRVGKLERQESWRGNFRPGDEPWVNHFFKIRCQVDRKSGGRKSGIEDKSDCDEDLEKI